MTRRRACCVDHKQHNRVDGSTNPQKIEVVEFGHSVTSVTIVASVDEAQDFVVLNRIGVTFTLARLFFK